jgi:hypothetical protein
MMQTLHIADTLHRRLIAHLFPGDRDEHGAVIIAGIVESPRGTRFLAKEIVLARDGVDYVPGTRGYRALTTDFIVRITDRCAKENLCYFAAHCHGGRDSVSFSPDDLASHRRGYPALLDITKGGPVGALVFAENAVAGSVWRRSGVTQLNRVTVVGPNLRHYFPSPPAAVRGMNPIYSRQSLLFGRQGQASLAQAKVGIIGLGGVGSLVNEWLAHLGVGHIVGIDFDYLEPSNRPRVVGATPWGAGEPFVHSRYRFIQDLGKRLAKRKVRVAERVAKRANPAITFEAIVGNVMDLKTAQRLRDVDYLFLCADGMQPRLVFNALVHQFLIPGVQIGSKVPIDKKSGAVLNPFLVSRRVLPQIGGGCLSCNQLIPPDRLQEESLTPEERRRQAYVTDHAVTAPSVITLNALAAAQAANDFLFGDYPLTYSISFISTLFSSVGGINCTTNRHSLHPNSTAVV